MVSQIPELVQKIGETRDNDEDEGILMIGGFVSKMSMLNFILDDSGVPFQVIEEATQQAFEKAVNRLLASVSGEECDCKKCSKKYTCPESKI